jgi:hypothetical protein
MSKFLYEKEEELEYFIDNFKKNISKIVSDNEIDKWTWFGCGGESYGIQYSCPVEESLQIEINKLTKNQNPEWVESISNKIGSAIRACAFSISQMNKFGSNFQNNFKDKEICNIITVNIVIGILFNDDSVGESNGDSEFYKMIKFKCCDGEGKYGCVCND